MTKRSKSKSTKQTVNGNENIQIAGSHNVVNQIVNFFIGGTEAQRATRNRRAMLERVKNTWIKDVLEESLYNEVLIDLGMEERRGAVERLRDIQVRMPDRPDRVLPPGISMMEVYDDMNGAMLILGEPGSGKTTMLLELTRDCIGRAEKDDIQPIPVVFNLSSWDGKQTIDKWLVDELGTKYNVAKKIAKNWVMNDDLQLLFDGLDEVRQENREGCVKAINEFLRQSHGLTARITVCSRIADYEELTTKLNLKGAVLLQPLTLDQIEWYFDQVGPELDGARQALKNDKMLQELVKQPLILSILTLAYQGKPAEAIASNKLFDTINRRRSSLFENYIQKMFNRVARVKNELYSPEQTTHWLSWLARRMIKYDQSPLFIERIQPRWLEREQKLKMYNRLVRMNFMLTFVLSFGLCAGLLLWVGIGAESVFFGLFAGLFFGLIVMVILRQFGARFFESTSINTVDRLTYNLKTGLVAGLVVGLWIGLGAGEENGLIYGLGVGLSIGLLGGLLFGLQKRQVDTTEYPEERLYMSAKNFIFIGLIVWLLSGLLSGLLDRQTGGISLPSENLSAGLFTGLFFGLIAGLNYGGLALIRHYTLRFVLSKNNLIPFKLVPFLDYCVDHIFLRRVGGGYIFVHRLLMEHFADMYAVNEK